MLLLAQGRRAGERPTILASPTADATLVSTRYGSRLAAALSASASHAAGWPDDGRAGAAADWKGHRVGFFALAERLNVLGVSERDLGLRTRARRRQEWKGDAPVLKLAPASPATR